LTDDVLDLLNAAYKDAEPEAKKTAAKALKEVNEAKNAAKV